MQFHENVKNKDLVGRDASFLWHPYTQHRSSDDPLCVASAKGAYLYDGEGKAYLDMISSWWVNIHGHGRTELAAAISRQALNLDHVHFAGVTHEPAVALAEQLVKLSGLGDGTRLFYSDNGSTAVEVALKICHQYWRNRGQHRPRIMTFRGGYHGDTLGAMTVGESSGFFDAFRSWMFEVDNLEVPHTWRGASVRDEESACIRAFKEKLGNISGDVAALIVEPLIQGAAGMRFHSPEFLSEICRLARSAGIPVVFDEVMTGFFRTGTLFAYMQTDVLPDLVCLSKGITGGILPLGATLVKGEYFSAFLGDSFSEALAHGHSFTGNPITCAAALASLDLLEKGGAASVVARISSQLADGIEKLERRFPIEKTRVLGGIGAFELKGKSGDYAAGGGRPLARYCQDHGVLLRPLGNVVYMMPPYCVLPEDLELAFAVLEDYFSGHGIS